MDKEPLTSVTLPIKPPSTQHNRRDWLWKAMVTRVATIQLVLQTRRQLIRTGRRAHTQPKQRVTTHRGEEAPVHKTHTYRPQTRSPRTAGDLYPFCVFPCISRIF